MSDNKNYILYGGEEPGDVGEGCKSLGEFLLKKLREHGDKVAFIDGLTSAELSFSKLLQQSMHLANCLANFGIKSGDVIGITSENRLEFPVVAYATCYLGAVMAPMNVTYTEREYDHAFNLSHPKIVFTSQYAAEKVLNIAKNNPSIVKKVILLGVQKRDDKLSVGYNNFITNPKLAKKRPLNPAPVNTSEKVVLILCSSGTTGLPKGVMITHDNILSTINVLKDNASIQEIDPDDICFLGVIPWFHAFGCLTLLIMSSLGQKMVYLPKFEDRPFLNCIQKYKVTHIFMVPPLMVFLAKHPFVDEYDLSSLVELACGAAPLSKEVEDAVKARIGVPSIKQGFGMSETTLGVLRQSTVESKPGSVGTLFRGTYGKVVNPDTGELLGPNQPGELCFKGKVIMKGYINNEKETKNTLRDGWLHSGDIGYYNEDGEFFIIDRLKELIKYKGFQVPPAEVEAILLTHPKVKDAAVIGIPDDEAGELPLAFIVKQENVIVQEKEIIEFVASQASPAKRLHGGVRFINEIPKNASGKILRRQLREQLKNPVSKL